MKQKQKVVARQEVKTKPKNVVDQAFDLDQEIKARMEVVNKLKEELELLKGQLATEAIAQETHELSGEKATVVFSDVVSYDVNLELMFEWLKKNKKQNLLSTVVKPSITELKKYIGEYSLEEFAIKNKKEYARAKFIPIK